MAAEKEVKYKVTAEDATASAFAQLKSNIQSATKGFDRMKAAIVGLATAGAFASFVAGIREAIKEADELGKAAQRIGIATAELSGLAYAAKLAGLDLEGLEKGIKGLNSAIFDASVGIGKAKTAFDTLKVSVTDANSGALRPTVQVLLDLADRFAGMDEGASKAGVAMQIFGDKIGPKMLPFLNQGRRGISQLTDELRRMGGVIDDEFAAAAEKFNDDLTALEQSSKRLKISLANDLLPDLTNITKAMREAAQESGTLMAAWVGLGGIAHAVFSGSEIRNTNNALQATREEIERLETLKARGSQVFGPKSQADLDAAKEKLTGLVAKLAELRGEGPKKPTNDSGASVAAANFLKQFETQAEKMKDAMAMLDGFRQRDLITEAQYQVAKTEIIKRYTDQGAASAIAALKAKRDEEQQAFEWGRKLTDAEKAQIELLDGKYKQYGKAVEDLARKIIAQRLETDKLIRTRQQLMLLDKEMLAQQEEFDAASAQNITAATATINSLADQIATTQLEISAMGMSNDQRELLMAGLKRERDLRGVLDEGQRNNINTLNDTIEAQIKQRAEQEKNLSVWNDVADRSAKFLGDLESSGGKVFKTLSSSLANFGRELLAFSTKRYILQIGASMLGGTSGAALANTASTMGQGSMLGSVANGIGSLFSGGGSGMLGSIGSGIGSLFGGGGSGAGGMAWAGGGWGGADIAATAAGSSGGLGSMLAAGGPYIAAALAIYALVKQFGDKGENAQSRLGFGTGIEGGGNAGYRIDGYFGKEGFQSSTMPTAFNLQLLDYFKSTGVLDNQIGKLITTSQREAITARLNGQTGNQYAFATGDNTGTEQLSLEYLKTKYGEVFKEINAGFASSISTFSGTSEELLKKIGGFVTGFELVKSSIESLRATAETLGSANGVEALRRSLVAMRTAMIDTRDEFNAAVADNTDMTRIAAAEDAYAKAVMNRYNTEMQLINNLVASLRQINSERYGAAKDIAGRFASIDGTDYQGNADRAWAFTRNMRQNVLPGTSDPATRLAVVADGLRAWDDWFNANRDRIQAGADEWRKITANETAALNEQLSLQQIQLAGLQKMKDLAQQASDALLGTSLSSANPASAGIRYQLAGENIAQLQSMFAMTTGDVKIGYGQKLISAAQDRLNSAGAMYDRPSAEYQDAYNSAISIMAQVQQSAMDAAASIPSVEQSIADTVAGIKEQAEILKSIDRIQEDALKEYKDTYRLGLEFAQGVQKDAYDQLQSTATAQLNAITGGLDAATYQNILTATTHLKLDQIATALETKVVGALDRLTTAITTPGNTTTTTTTTGGGGTGGGGGGNGTEQTISIPIDLNIDGQAMEGFVVKAVIRNGSVIKREFVNA